MMIAAFAAVTRYTKSAYMPVAKMKKAVLTLLTLRCLATYQSTLKDYCCDQVQMCFSSCNPKNTFP